MYSCRFINEWGEGGGGYLAREGDYLACYFTESGINQYVGQETLTDVFGGEFVIA